MLHKVGSLTCVEQVEEPILLDTDTSGHYELDAWACSVKGIRQRSAYRRSVTNWRLLDLDFPEATDLIVIDIVLRTTYGLAFRPVPKSGIWSVGHS